MKRESRKTVRIVIPMSELLKLEDPQPQPIQRGPLIVGTPKPKLDWVTIFGIGCMLVITATAIISTVIRHKRDAKP
jgi:hypothetical protein